MNDKTADRILSSRRISPQELRRHGWTWTRFVKSMADRQFEHQDGWIIRHCGHPTALWPYELWNPAGQMILTGAAAGNPPDYGTAWPTVAAAVAYVASLSAGTPSRHA